MNTDSAVRAYATEDDVVANDKSVSTVPYENAHAVGGKHRHGRAENEEAFEYGRYVNASGGHGGGTGPRATDDRTQVGDVSAREFNVVSAEHADTRNQRDGLVV